jgi:high-affinity iron transporter
MLATLVIGLREGLEAALIVGIIAAFLRRTGKPLRPMWIGVGAAVTLSVAVGVVLQVISADLPQAQQEGMESIIGLIAVAIVTGMIGWMNRHARSMRAELENSAAHALHDGTVWALVGMAFLAVLKEGFETSVFLLAAFQASTSSLAAGGGAVIGVGIAIAIGIGIYRGGARINLGKFFRITGLFLVLVAAGLVLSSLRTAHEAGWILIGQQPTVTLSWLAPNGSVQAALLTGVLGIPADPRLIEVLGWFAYIVPVLLYLLWPASKRPTERRLPALWLRFAGGFAVAAVVLAIAVPLPAATVPASVPLDGAGISPLGTASLTSDGDTYHLTVRVGAGNASERTAFSRASTSSDIHNGVASRFWERTAAATPANEPTTLSLTSLIALSGGRVPIGVNASQNSGPFAASWQSRTTTSVWAAGSMLLDASRRSTTIVTLSGGGLASPRTISATSPNGAPSWTIASGYADRTATAITTAATQRAELLLWKLYLPIVLALAAIALCVFSLRARRGMHKRAAAAEDRTTQSATKRTHAAAQV